ncbi:MAG: 50S ribosomal protein L19e [Candidatus Diapherotrites archaeon]|nr:50S ribosomal protein L19e [Candidatus Diapherotrites archaeon]
MELNQVKQVAAKVYKVGKDRVKIIDETRAREAITRDDIRQLVKEKAIIIKSKRGTSRGRARVLKAQKKRGRRKGPGMRKGKKTARESRKKKWIKKVRAQRKKLKEIRPDDYRSKYRMVKAGFFKSVKHLLSAIKKE